MHRPSLFRSFTPPLLPGLAALLCAVLLSGCFGPKYLYENADWLTMRELDKHFCPAGERRDAAKSEVQKLLRWHRKHELPRWVKALNRFAAAIEDDGLKEPDLTRFLDEVTRAWGAWVKRSSDPFEGWLADVRPEELACLQKQFAEYEKESSEEFAANDKRWREKALKRGIDWTERFLGDLSDAQKATVARMINLRRKPAQRVAKARLAANQRFLEAMRNGKAGPAAFRKLTRDPFALYTPEERALVEARRAHFRKVLYATAALMTTDQRRALRTRMQGWAADLRSVARSSPSR
jgi:hypothetical protein